LQRKTWIMKPKVRMTKAEFRAKLEHSSAQAAQGFYVEKRPDETAQEFLERISKV